MDQIKNCQKELDTILNKYNLRIGITQDFPVYKKLPIEVQLALQVLKRHEVEYRMTFMERKDK